MPDTDPAVTQDLTELEAALAGAPDANPELLAFVADVRGTRPEADPAFLAGLERQVAAGFPASQKRRWHRPSLRVALPAVSIAAAAMIATIVISQSGTGGPPTSEPTAISSAPPAAAGGDTAAKSLGTATPGPSRTESGAAPVQRGRQVERSASMTIAAPKGEVQDTTDKIVDTTNRLGGYVARSSISIQEGAGTADLQLRVPSARLDEAMAALAKLGDVRSMDQAEQDITGTFSAASAALEDARAERQGLLSGLRKAGDPDQIARFKARLRENAARIAAADAALTAVRNRAARATISVQVVTGGKSGGAEVQEQGFGLNVAVATAVRVLSASAGVLILILAAAIPLAAVTLVGVAALRSTRRRRRERALEDADR